MARLWRDQQIALLEGEPNRTPKQEEQLRTLRLEKEFQRRAEEAAKGDDEDNDDDDVCFLRCLLADKCKRIFTIKT